MGDELWSEQYRIHNMRGSDGPCMCADCQDERASNTAESGVGGSNSAEWWQPVVNLVNEQANDEGLWFVAQTAPEAYLQQALRRLHAAIEEAKG